MTRFILWSLMLANSLSFFLIFVRCSHGVFNVWQHLNHIHIYVTLCTQQLSCLVCVYHMLTSVCNEWTFHRYYPTPRSDSLHLKQSATCLAVELATAQWQQQCACACLQTAGVVFSISNAILGLTLLAWGNSIGGMSCCVCVCLFVSKTVDVLAFYLLSQRIYEGFC